MCGICYFIFLIYNTTYNTLISHAFHHNNWIGQWFSACLATNNGYKPILTYLPYFISQPTNFSQKLTSHETITSSKKILSKVFICKRTCSSWLCVNLTTENCLNLSLQWLSTESVSLHSISGAAITMLWKCCKDPACVFTCTPQTMMKYRLVAALALISIYDLENRVLCHVLPVCIRSTHTGRLFRGVAFIMVLGLVADIECIPGTHRNA